MQFKKHCFSVFFATMIMFLLNACIFGISKDESNISPTLTSELPVLPTETVTPVASPTSTSSSTPASTPLVTLLPSPTVTLVFAPTFTPTPQWSTCPGIVITQTDTKKGDMLHILRCEDGLEYDLGPLAKGVYAVGPNDKFLVYITSDGFIYAAKIGDRYLNSIFNLAREHVFSAFNKQVAPDFKISFVGEEPFYKLVLFERVFYQKRVYDLPLWIMQ
jgi:hypothetical protein